jgi:hypothetical protein
MSWLMRSQSHPRWGCSPWGFSVYLAAIGLLPCAVIAAAKDFTRRGTEGWRERVSCFLDKWAYGRLADSCQDTVARFSGCLPWHYLLATPLPTGAETRLSSPAPVRPFPSRISSGAVRRHVAESPNPPFSPATYLILVAGARSRSFHDLLHRSLRPAALRGYNSRHP